jgi:PKD repeat protein
VNLSYAGSPSQFTGTIPLAAEGTYNVVVYAYEPSTGNTGLDRTTIVVGQEAPAPRANADASVTEGDRH